MRLACPNCGARYEVPDEVIPATGRDVQCSNCGDTWFQHHPNHMPAGAEPSPDMTEDHQTDTTTGDPFSDDDYDAVPDDPSDQLPDITETETELSDGNEPDLPDHTTAEDAPPEHSPADSPPRRELDPAIRDLLREEAEREQQARAADSGGLETQTEMGLDQADEDQRTREARERMARLRGQDQSDAGQTHSQPADAAAHSPANHQDTDHNDHAEIDPESRRNLLPDIDEINSSLDSDPSHRPDSAVARDAENHANSQKSGGFRRGFALSVLLFAALTLIYVFAPQIAGMHPALEIPMASYVSAIDSLRSLLNGAVASFVG